MQKHVYATKRTEMVFMFIKMDMSLPRQPWMAPFASF